MRNSSNITGNTQPDETSLKQWCQNYLISALNTPGFYLFRLPLIVTCFKLRTSVSDPFRIRIELFFLSPDPDPWKKRHKTVSTRKKNVFISYLALSTVNTQYSPFWKVSPKPNQKHHLDLNGLLMDGSGFLKSGSGSAKKTRIHPDPNNRIIQILKFSSVVLLKPNLWGGSATLGQSPCTQSHITGKLRKHSGSRLS